MATYNCTVDGWRSRQSGAWFPSSGFANIGSATGNGSNVASNPSGNNKYTILIRVKTPNYAGISSISKVSITCRFYKGNTSSGTLYGSLRTKYDDLTSSDTASTYRNNAIGSEVSKTYASTSYGSFTFEFSGTFATNTYYYLVLYSKSNNDMFFTNASNLQPSAVATYTAKTFTISYDANGGTNAPSSQTKTYGTALTLSSTKPTKADGSNPVNGSYVITGNANGGYFGNTSTTTTTITATTSRTDTIKYTFSKWNTAKDGSGTNYNAGASYTTEAGATLYAIYSSSTTTGTTSYSNNAISKLATPSHADTTQATYTITFDSKGGSNCSNQSAKKTRKYTFGGWGTSANATSANASATYNSATTVYAYWSTNDTTAKITLPTPTKSGYTFVGWSSKAEATTADIGKGDYTPTANTTLYAVWSMDNSLIHYNNNGTDVVCAVYVNDNGTAVACIVYYNDNGTPIRI